MIIQPTAEQTRRVTRSRAYSGPGFGPRSFEFIGLSAGAGLAAVASSGGAPTFASALGADLLQWCRADLGVTQSGGLVSNWSDLGTLGHAYSATSTARPTWGATAGPNSTPAITFDGAANILSCATLNLPAPGTTPVWIWLMARQDSWTSTRRLFGAASGSNSTLLAYQNGSSPQIMQYAGANANTITTAAVGVWCALQFYFSNSTADFTKVNDDAPVTGASAGNTASTGRALGGVNGGLFSAISVAEIVIAKALPQQSTISAIRLARYGF